MSKWNTQIQIKYNGNTEISLSLLGLENRSLVCWILNMFWFEINSWFGSQGFVVYAYLIRDVLGNVTHSMHH